MSAAEQLAKLTASGLSLDSAGGDVEITAADVAGAGHLLDEPVWLAMLVKYCGNPQPDLEVPMLERAVNQAARARWPIHADPKWLPVGTMKHKYLSRMICMAMAETADPRRGFNLLKFGFDPEAWHYHDEVYQWIYKELNDLASDGVRVVAANLREADAL